MVLGHRTCDRTGHARDRAVRSIDSRCLFHCAACGCFDPNRARDFEHVERRRARRRATGQRRARNSGGGRNGEFQIMRVQKEIAEDELPPARPTRSRVPPTADADHQELVRQRRELEAAEVVGDPQDGEQVTSERLRLRRLQKVRMAPKPLHSNPRRVGSNAVLTATPDEAAAEESRLHRSDEATADQEGGGLEIEPTADNQEL